MGLLFRGVTICVVGMVGVVSKPACQTAAYNQSYPIPLEASCGFQDLYTHYVTLNPRPDIPLYTPIYPYILHIYIYTKYMVQARLGLKVQAEGVCDFEMYLGAFEQLGCC